MSEDGLIGSFEPDNMESMISDYNEICNKIDVTINSIDKLSNNSIQLLRLLNTLQSRKSGFERQFESHNIEYTKR